MGDLENDMNKVKPKKSPQVVKENMKNNKPRTPNKNHEKVNGNMASYASIAASTKEPPQLLSPMVFTGQNQPQQPQKDLCNKSKPLRSTYRLLRSIYHLQMAILLV